MGGLTLFSRPEVQKKVYEVDKRDLLRCHTKAQVMSDRVGRSVTIGRITLKGGGDNRKQFIWFCIFSCSSTQIV